MRPRAPSTPSSPSSGAERVRYLDLMRVVAICGVVVGHWLVIDITYADGRLSGHDALAQVGRTGLLTFVFQVMPVFFVVGGYVNAASWSAHRERGVTWARWVQGRTERLLWPTTVYLASALVTVAALRATVLDGGEASQAGRLLTLHLWFVPVYLLVTALTPATLAAHRRWGLLVPALAAAAIALADAGSQVLHLPPAGYVNYLLVWGSMHQWGFAWREGSLTRSRRRPWILAGSGAVCFAILVTAGPYPVDLVGAGDRAGNTSPPTLALLAFAAAQTGLMLAGESSGGRFLERPDRWHRVRVLNGATMAVYLWHMIPVLAVALVAYPLLRLPQPRIDSPPWWLGRPVWVVALALVLVPVVLGVTRLHRPLRRIPPPAGPGGATGAVTLCAGLAAACFALVRLATTGVAPDGGGALTVLAGYGVGVALVAVAGHGPRARPGPVRRRVPPHG